MTKWKSIVPNEYHSYFENEVNRVQDEGLSEESLRDEVDELFQHHKASFKNSDMSRFLEIVSIANDLLEASRDLSKEDRLIALSAVSYLVNDDDAVEDDSLFDGFEDDEEILSAVKQGLEI